jgi:ATP-binding cassette subfamily C protein/ATP-binding cassette subfamily C protein LapB
MSFLPQELTGNGGCSNVVAAQQRLIEQHFASVKARQQDKSTPASICLGPLLEALKWSGEARQLAEAMPSSATVHDLYSLRSVLETLNFTSTARTAQLSDITTEMVPCLFEHTDGHLVLITQVMSDETLAVFDSRTQKTHSIKPDARRGKAYVVKPVDRVVEHADARRGGWMAWLLSRFRPTFSVLLGLSLAINILALSLPLFIMGVYQYAIGSQVMSIVISFTCQCL